MDNMREVSRPKFLSLWEELTPHVIIMKPMTDLCWTCQKNRNVINGASNKPIDEKMAVLEEQKRYLHAAGSERKFYKEACELSKLEVRRINYALVVIQAKTPCSFEGTMHYSFDYAQQLHYPANPLQPGPIYFKTPRKCQLFGVVAVATTRQVNYLIDEALSV